MTLFEAVRTQDVKLVKAALAGEKDVNVLGPEGRTPLIEAAALGLYEIAKALLDAGAEPEWKADDHETALLKAAANGHARLVQLLEPHASEEDRELARSFLKAYGKADAPEYQYDGAGLKRTAAEVAARAASFVGDDGPLQRLERVARSEKNKKR